MSTKILVMDPDPGILKFFKYCLESKGHEVITAKDGVEGIAQLEDVRPGLIILDVLMPIINGHTFVKILNKYEQFSFIPVLVVAEKADLKDLFRMEGINNFISKPFDPQRLLKKVEELLGI